MFRRCKHEWKEINRKSVKGVLETGSEFEFGGGLWGPEYDDVLYGYTLFLYECSRCGTHTTKQLRGSWPT
jgi:hypothetical protein